eukprot:jgi/Picre1/32015/NNA_007363.t1
MHGVPQIEYECITTKKLRLLTVRYYYDYDASGRQDGVDVDVDARKEDADEEKKRVLQAARVFCLTKDEVYFLESASELQRPLNHRNEAAALSLIQHCIHSSMGEDVEPEHGLLALLEYVNGLCAESVWNELNTGELNSFGNHDILSCIHASSSEKEGDSSTAPRQASREAFLAWALKDNRIESRVIPAECEGGIQGCVAVDDIHIGEDVLKIPVDVLLYDETVLKTDVGAMLSVIPDVSIDNILIIFTRLIDLMMIVLETILERIPDAFKTGISFHESVLNLLEGSAAFNEIQKAQKHIRDQYDVCAPLFDALVTAYPKYLTRDMFTQPSRYSSLTLEIPSYREEVEQALQRTGVTLDHNLRHGPLSSKLKACLRIIVSTPDELEGIKRGDMDPLVGPIGQDNEKHAMEMALTALQGILEPLQGAMRRFDEALSKVPLQWRMSAAFCRIYLENQIKIIESNICHVEENL